jgi:ABC-type uncharacterized transport system auxiliary subunit
LVALFLIFVLAGCWSGAPVENDTAFSSSPTEEGGEKHGHETEVHVARPRARLLEPPPAAVVTAPKQKPITCQAPTLLASVAPKPHPSRLSVRRQQ